jgi:hypothetical protein
MGVGGPGRGADLLGGTGWGQGTGTPPRQGDLGAGVLSTSQEITRRSMERTAARNLADAVRAFLDREQISDSELEAALDAFDRSHS